VSEQFIEDYEPENPDDALLVAPVYDQLENQNLNERLKRIEERLDAVAGVDNTIGGMMNQVADTFAQIMEQVQKGGIGSLLGGMMGGKKNDG